MKHFTIEHMNPIRTRFHLYTYTYSVHLPLLIGSGGASTIRGA